MNISLKPSSSGFQCSDVLACSKKCLVIKIRAQGSHWSDTSFIAAVELGFSCGATVTPAGQSDQELKA